MIDRIMFLLFGQTHKPEIMNKILIQEVYI